MWFLLKLLNWNRNWPINGGPMWLDHRIFGILRPKQHERSFACPKNNVHSLCFYFIGSATTIGYVTQVNEPRKSVERWTASTLLYTMAWNLSITKITWPRHHLNQTWFAINSSAFERGGSIFFQTLFPIWYIVPCAFPMKIGPRWVPRNPIDKKSTLVQVTALCHQAPSPSQCWPKFMSPYGVTRPQWGPTGQYLR